MTTTQLDDIPGLFRCETVPRTDATAQLLALTKQLRGRAEDDVYTVHQHVDCPPEVLYDYLLDIRSVEEFTYSMRGFRPEGTDGRYVGEDATDPATKIHLRIHGNAEVGTVDYESAFDQGDDLWMVFCGRVLSARRVQNRSGALVSWTIWRHPYYARNPYPHLSPRRGRVWPGSFWPLFHACDVLELRNMQQILEHRLRVGSATVGGR
ncbi:SRPBCC family protein [Nocardia sp. NPDC052316]|uniref:SRPBCC family protein n=1 Tax=Nocardia sp. NPDC052316 TaxID=3364329 RepID=UPI0037C9F73E